MLMNDEVKVMIWSRRKRFWEIRTIEKDRDKLEKDKRLTKRVLKTLRTRSTKSTTSKHQAQTHQIILDKLRKPFFYI
jgi:uncharacterized protein (DUF2267 family)